VRLVLGTDEPESFFKSADLFVLPSVQDGFGMVVLEAMACGVPVIVTENVGAKDFVKNGVNGLLIEPLSEEEISNAIFLFYENRDLSFQMGREARKQALQIKWEKYQKQLLEVLFKLAL
jgi:glycosyltransferase involved in cell wall biosynthesis